MRPKKRFTESERRRIIDAYKDDVKLVHIAQRFSCSPDSIKLVLGDLYVSRIKNSKKVD